MTADRNVRQLLRRTSCFLPGTGTASDYANQLLTAMGASVVPCDGPADPHPAIAWAGCGLMSLTGNSAGEAQMCPAPLASCADGVIMAIGTITGSINRLPPSGAMLLGERAAIAGLQRQGPTSPGGSCRLMGCADGWLALNLARVEDWAMLPAWLEREIEASWNAVATGIANRESMPLVERGRLMGLAVAAVDPPAPQPPPWLEVNHCGTVRAPDAADRPLVLDLSALWAGPLCSHLLQALGARVIRVESRQRPDGARQGPQAFDDLVNAGKQSLVLDFASAAGREGLRQLLLRADIVIEGSRPRALRQLGIIAEEMLAKRPGLSWMSISGYGRSEPEADWAAYGDDAGVAAGLSGLLLELTGEALICGDAIADPLTGMHAALAAWASYRCGGGKLISLSLRNVVAHCTAFSLPASPEERRARWLSWQAMAQEAGLAETRPQARLASGKARPPGADTRAIFEEFGISC